MLTNMRPIHTPPMHPLHPLYQSYGHAEHHSPLGPPVTLLLLPDLWSTEWLRSLMNEPVGFAEDLVFVGTCNVETVAVWMREMLLSPTVGIRLDRGSAVLSGMTVLRVEGLEARPTAQFPTWLILNEGKGCL